MKNLFLWLATLVFIAALPSCSTTSEANFSAWFTSPKTQATLHVIGAVAESIGLAYAELQGVISPQEAAQISGVISSVRQLETTPGAANPAAIKQTIIDNTGPSVNGQALADAFARGVAVAQAKVPTVPASVVLEAAAAKFPVGVQNAVAKNARMP